MGAGAELFILPIGAMCLFSIGAFFAAFFSRTFARICAGLAFASMALFLFLILQMNRWNFEWLLYLLMNPPFLFVCLYGSIFLSFIAVLAPLRHLEKVLSNESHEPWGWTVLILGGLIAIFVAGYITVQFVEDSRGEQKIISMLAGDANIRFNRFQTDYQQRRVICTDPEALRYLEERFRKADPGRRELGTTYQLSVSFEGGGAKSFSTYWSDSGNFNFFLGDPGDGWKGHGILLEHPRPRSIDMLVEFLGKNNREIAGTVLILEPGCSRVERDEALVAK